MSEWLAAPQAWRDCVAAIRRERRTSVRTGEQRRYAITRTPGDEADILWMRKSGYTYVALAQLLAVSAARPRQIVEHWLTLLNIYGGRVRRGESAIPIPPDLCFFAARELPQFRSSCYGEENVA